MTTLEKIRAEIEQLEDACSKEHGCIAEVLQIFDKYAVQEPRVKNELNVELNELKPCEDAVSRQAVLKAIDKWYENNNQLLLNDCIEDLIVDAVELPSVQPKQKTGHWIDYSDEGYVECPFCEHATNCEGNIDELHYCFWCGAKMVEPRESEDKE